MAYLPIESYGIIGDLRTVALVGMNGCIDFLCFPHFDSPSVFAALLDDTRGGRFQIAPRFDGDRVRYKQIYLPDTNVLLTRFLSDEGVAEITDFMPIGRAGHAHNLIRRVRTVRGKVCFQVLCDPRFDYGRAERHSEKQPNAVIFTSKGRDGTRLRLRTTADLALRDGAAYGEMTLDAGQSVDFILEELDPETTTVELSEQSIDTALNDTVAYWRRWIGRSRYKGRWREMVNRSALVLKLLVSSHHGTVVAAPTFGLPETIGGERNWDYRYTWIRDSAFTLFSLSNLGYTDEAAAFMRWIEKRCGDIVETQNKHGPLQVLYGIDGREDLPEEILEHFEGYKKSAPVRIGNAAADQLQLDIYGELIDAIYVFNQHRDPISYDLWRKVSQLVDWVCANWDTADEGIWEVRGGRQHFLYSRLMCWVAIDRGVRIAWNRSFPADVDRWTKVRDAIHKDIYATFWNDERGCFVQHKGSTAVDASSLLMPIVHFVAPTDPRWLSHLKAVENELLDDSLVYRYRLQDGVDDGLHGTEGTFSMCSFWYADNLARAGQLDKARFYFEKMLGYANHLGLYSEQLGPMGEHLGNFPQAFTHLGVITAAMSLDAALSEMGWLA